MIKEIKIQDKINFPEGQWVKITNERNISKVNDEDIYFYVEDSIDLSSLRIGDKIFLDEKFKIIDLI